MMNRTEKKKKKRSIRLKHKATIQKRRDSFAPVSSPPKKLRGPNAKKIVDFLKSEGIKGDYRDYVLFVGDRLIDYRKSHNIAGLRVKQTNQVGIALVHKKQLIHLLPKKIALLFWHPTMGRLGARCW